jgi:hypothetical protein
MGSLIEEFYTVSGTKVVKSGTSVLFYAKLTNLYVDVHAGVIGRCNDVRKKHKNVRTKQRKMWLGGCALA